MIPFHHPLETDPIILYLTQVPSLVPLLFKFCNSLRAYCSTHMYIRVQHRERREEELRQVLLLKWTTADHERKEKEESLAARQTLRVLHDESGGWNF